MIHYRFSQVVFALLMAFFMSCIMSFVITLFNVGVVENLLFIWVKAWAFAFVVAFPAILIVAPFVHKIVAKVVKPAPSK